MPFNKYLLTIFIISTLAAAFPANTFCEEGATAQDISAGAKLPIEDARLKEALLFCKKRKYNTDFCIMADLGKHSGLKRLFVYDFKQRKILLSAMVSHGCGKMPWSWTWSKDKPSFSNTDGSHCSSLGKYRVGKRGYSNWGIHVNYLLYGLEKTNNNAFSRQIVLHSWEEVPDHEPYPQGTPEGWGCPATSNKAMKWIDKKLQTTKKPVLLWIYN